MCGILAVMGCVDNSQTKRSRIIELSGRLKHRGPDWSGLHCHGDCYLAHQRLAIVDSTSGDQPLYNEDKTVIVTESNGQQQTFKWNSNPQWISPWLAGMKSMEKNSLICWMGCSPLSFLTRDKSFIAARDAIGITPLYLGWALDGSTWFASEMKALSDDCERFISFPPGHIYSRFLANRSKFYQHPIYDPMVLRQAFEKTVLKRLMTDVPFGVLLSGGLDSSLVAAVTNRYVSQSAAAQQWGSQLHSFCIGLKGSPDLKAAKEVADYLGTRHYELYFTVQEGIDALEEVIYHMETYDVTTMRASTPMFLMSRKIKAMGVKMVLSGEGSDEIFGGYLYFHKAPNKEEFHEETCRKIKALHLYDCLRANKSTSAWGIEARVPFLDKEFINTAMSFILLIIVYHHHNSSVASTPYLLFKIRPDLGRIEKWVLRNAFDVNKSIFTKAHFVQAEGTVQ
ncbi:Asparagine synthetase [glutamine-hydrolyzing] 3 [Stylosanthes scabra]|uniref:Asparagine synthetase [glutamine-hydrolyzing] n=1 Tax=Stylosanthes scabra TaxID=79078 RepID=A0ABU6ZQY5_9FABA|nr:Asparagine synthetase [glutamine-hydrolyzing] 3 [Stylosanthes scabra]